MLQRLDTDRNRLTRQEIALLTLARLYSGRNSNVSSNLRSAIPSTQKLALSVGRISIEDLLNGSPTLLCELVQVEQACTVSEKNLANSVPTKGIHFAHSVQELIDVLSPPGTMLEVASDDSGRIWSMAIYHTDGQQFALEDEELVNRAFEFVDTSGKALLQPIDKLAVGHCVCVDPDAAKSIESGGSGNLAASIYGLHDDAFERGLEEAKCTIAIATCRSDNPAIESHIARSWRFWDEHSLPQITKSHEIGRAEVVLKFNLIKRIPAWLRARKTIQF